VARGKELEGLHWAWEWGGGSGRFAKLKRGLDSKRKKRGGLIGWFHAYSSRKELRKQKKGGGRGKRHTKKKKVKNKKHVGGRRINLTLDRNPRTY